MPNEIPLRYGMNPHQKTARVFVTEGDLPVEVVSGAPGFINMCDALNAWALVKELRAALGLPAAASFKHVSPAGAAVAVPLSDAERQAFFVDDMADLSPLAVAYARARGADRMSSFGDFAAFSDTVDRTAAELLSREVSDGCIAPAYDDDALAVLRSKRGGKYLALAMDPDFEPPETETRTIYGVCLEQTRNAALFGPDLLRNVVTKKKNLPKEAVRDLVVGSIALKYTQSNSVAFATSGQAIGIGAGQQSRVHCTRLAGSKADIWWLRQHPRVLQATFKDGLNRAEMNNAIDQYLLERPTPLEERAWREAFDPVPDPLSPEERADWIARLDGVSLASDAFFPFRDSIDRAAQSGVKYVVQPGGSERDDLVIAACDEHGMVMAFSGLRLFHH
ncbi:MAG: 5-aminoimidazole-4-carboxamide ribonucleotide transformylase [Planctomycetes bacterium DG_20]|nr:MAG: 5-aminoimidazole-4-carboxamide ribonucleotide transformylase [Planctomycetes bacterium DG_20]